MPFDTLKRLGLEMILRTYGFIIDEEFDRLKDFLFISSSPDVFLDYEVECYEEKEGTFYYDYHKSSHFNLFAHRDPTYYALLPHVTFKSENFIPLWVNKKGNASIGWYQKGLVKRLFVGFNIEEEIVRYRQGNPANIFLSNSNASNRYGFSFERPNYLFEGQIQPSFPTIPWADRLCFFLAEILAQLLKYPLVEPLPRGAKGMVVVTGDDDQAYLDKYDAQLKMIGALPITYFLHHRTRHTRETISQMPSNVEFGLHPDTLDKPFEYDQLCTEQAQQICQLIQKPVHIVRNHGFLNHGYLGHLSAWEKNDLQFDVNYPGVDGTCLTGSFLPMEVRRHNGTWSDHYSLLTAFGDGMIYALKMSQNDAIRKIRRLVKQIETDHPAVLVFNLHPQNIDKTYKLHGEVIDLVQKRSWAILGLETYLRWLGMLRKLRIKRSVNSFILDCDQEVRGLALRFYGQTGWIRKEVEPWCGQTIVKLN